MHPATDKQYDVTMILPPDISYVTEYMINVYELHWTATKWERVRFVEGLVFDDFPYTIHYLPRGLYAITVNGYSQSRLFSILSEHKRFGVSTKGRSAFII